MRTLPACSATNSLPSGANSMSVGYVKPLTTRDSVKPDSLSLPSSSPAPPAKTGTAMATIIRATTIVAAIVTKSRMTRCILCSFPLKRDAHRCSTPRGQSTIPLQSRNTPSKDAPPQPAAHNPPKTPRKQLTPRFKEEFVASNDKPLVKKGDTATTSLVNREALTGPSSVSRASCTAGVVSEPLASLSSRANASPSTFAKAVCAGAEETSVGVAAVARKESKIPRQKSAIPANKLSQK